MVAFFVLCANTARMVTIHQQYVSIPTHTYIHTQAQSDVLRVGVNRSDGKCTIMICIFCRYNFFLVRICMSACKSHTNNTVFILAKICGAVYRRFVCIKIIQCELHLCPLQWKFLVSRLANCKQKP